MSYDAQRAIFDADLAATEAEMPCAFLFNGVSYTGQKTPKVSELEMFATGYSPKENFDLSVRLSQFTTTGVTPPIEQEIITIVNVEYQIEKITTDQPEIEALYALKVVN